jgi:hypothetical protein
MVSTNKALPTKSELWRLTSAVLVTAARLRFEMNLNSLVWAAARDGGR